MNSEPRTFPDVQRTDSGIALVWPLYVATEAEQRFEANAIITGLRDKPLPDGFVSISVFASTDGETLLTYAQWSSDAAYRSFEAGLDNTVGMRVQPIRYAPYRSSVLDPESKPGILVAPTFDVDGPNRQRASIDALVDGPLSKPCPGLIASHFHASLDGSRVLNWAEWADEEAHEAFMQTSLPAECLDVITMPGVRGIGGKRYTLIASVTA